MLSCVWCVICAVRPAARAAVESALRALLEHSDVPGLTRDLEKWGLDWMDFSQGASTAAVFSKVSCCYVWDACVCACRLSAGAWCALRVCV